MLKCRVQFLINHLGEEMFGEKKTLTQCSVDKQLRQTKCGKLKFKWSKWYDVDLTVPF